MTKAQVLNLIANALRFNSELRVSVDGTVDDPALGIEFANGQFFFIDVREDSDAE